MTKASTLFLTDAQVAERIGLTTDEFKRILSGLERDGFPRADHVFCNRRYWPAIQSFLDYRYGLATSSSSGNVALPSLDEEEPWKRKRSA
jgi:hypothetical protein